MKHPDAEQDPGTVLRSLDPIEKLMLYVAGSEGKDLKSKVKMQKVMFLISDAFPDIFGDDIRFEAHKKGPYSQTVEDYLESMEDVGLINLPSCSLTEFGKEVSSGAVPREPLKGVVDSMKDLVTHLSEDEMLLMIYNDFPEYRRNSEEWDRISAERSKLAERMLSKHVVSAARAAELAGVSEDQFLDNLYEKGEKWRVAHWSIGFCQSRQKSKQMTESTVLNGDILDRISRIPDEELRVKTVQFVRNIELAVEMAEIDFTLLRIVCDICDDEVYFEWIFNNSTMGVIVSKNGDEDGWFVLSDDVGISEQGPQPLCIPRMVDLIDRFGRD